MRNQFGTLRSKIATNESATEQSVSVLKGSQLLDTCRPVAVGEECSAMFDRQQCTGIVSVIWSVSLKAAATSLSCYSIAHEKCHPTSRGAHKNLACTCCLPASKLLLSRKHGSLCSRVCVRTFM